MNATADVGWLESPSVLNSAVMRIQAVKAAGLDAAVDFHGRLHKPMALQLAAKLAPFDPLFIEEPLLSQFPAAIKDLAAHVSTPIALGERLHSRWDVVPFLESGAVSILQPDVSHCGGISELKRIAAMAEGKQSGEADRQSSYNGYFLHPCTPTSYLNHRKTCHQTRRKHTIYSRQLSCQKVKKVYRKERKKGFDFRSLQGGYSRLCWSVTKLRFLF